MDNKHSLSIQTAENLFKKHRSVCLPASGILRYSGIPVKDDSQYVKIVMCNSRQFIEQACLEKIEISLKICIEVEEQLCQEKNSFENFFESQIKPIFDVNDQRTFIISLIYSQGHSQELLKIIQFLQVYMLLKQTKQISILIKYQGSFASLQEYENQFGLFSSSILKKKDIFLPAISIIIEIPSCIKEQDKDKASLNLLELWKNMIPTSIGSIFINDWTHIHTNIVFNLHFVKKLEPLWIFQFITDQKCNAENLGCQCIGIN